MRIVIMCYILVTILLGACKKNNNIINPLTNSFFPLIPGAIWLYDNSMDPNATDSVIVLPDVITINKLPYQLLRVNNSFNGRSSIDSIYLNNNNGIYTAKVRVQIEPTMDTLVFVAYLLDSKLVPGNVIYVDSIGYDAVFNSPNTRLKISDSTYIVGMMQTMTVNGITYNNVTSTRTVLIIPDTTQPAPYPPLAIREIDNSFAYGVGPIIRKLITFPNNPDKSERVTYTLKQKKF
ncbi:MAG: hypothetical protein QM528_05705 [Phycisphaerales bacterium]|nr:hypothetical protein [Phycisphaerales bacterium]